MCSLLLSALASGYGRASAAVSYEGTNAREQADINFAQRTAERGTFDLRRTESSGPHSQESKFGCCAFLCRADSQLSDRKVSASLRGGHPWLRPIPSIQEVLPDRRFQFRPIARPLHLPVTIPRVAEEARTGEREGLDAEPLYTERRADLRRPAYYMYRAGHGTVLIGIP